MTKALVIAKRELAEKRFVFITAAIGALLPFLTTLLPMARTWTAPGMVSVTASIFATGLALGLAVSGGASMISRELVERRLSFYFAQPVGGVSIWFGKLLAALVMIFLAPLIVLTPALLYAGEQWRTFGGGQWAMIGSIALLSTAMLLFTHLVSTFVRSRSAVILFDFVLAAAAAFAIALMIRPLWYGLALHAITLVASVLGIGFLIAVVAGGAWQVADGRTDRKRSHAALSRAFWSLMGITVLGTGIYVAWLVSPKPSDLNYPDIQPAKTGNWVFMAGPAVHREDFVPGFVYDLQSGRYIRVQGRDLAWPGGTFTRDGRTAVLRPRLSPRGTTAELTLLPLGETGSRIDTGLTVKWDTPFVVSDGAERIAYVENGTLSVYDIPSRRSLVSIRVGADRTPSHMYFVSPDLLRFCTLLKSPGMERVVISELDLGTKAIQQTGELTTAAEMGYMAVSADASKMLFRAFSRGDTAAEALILADARTGARLFSIPREEGTHLSGSALLADGTVVAAIIRNGKATLRFLDGTGAVRREIPLGAADRALVAAELTGNRIVVTTAPERAEAWPHSFVINAATGEIVRQTDQVGLYGGDYSRNPRRGEPADRLLAGRTREGVVAWDPNTGNTRLITANRDGRPENPLRD